MKLEFSPLLLLYLTNFCQKYYAIHSKKCSVRLPYVKHALSVRYKTYVKRMDRALYV